MRWLLNPFGNSNGLYIPNIFDNKPSKCHLDSKYSNKSGKYRVRIKNPDPEIPGKFFEALFFFNREQFLLNDFFAEMVFSSKITI